MMRGVICALAVGLCATGCARGPTTNQVLGTWCSQYGGELILRRNGDVSLIGVREWYATFETRGYNAKGRWRFTEAQFRRKFFADWWRIKVDLEKGPAADELGSFEADYGRSLGGGPDFIRIFPFEAGDEKLVRFYRCGGEG